MMTAIECPTSKDLKALTLGQLPSEDSDALFQHISECELCRSELETVEDTGDSLIASLRSPDQDSEFSGEPDCQVAVAKALGALATAGRPGTTAELEQLPSSIGEYEIVRPIGRGGMGNVYLAQHTKLGREVALKVLASHRLADARMRERFEAEMLAVGRLSHPNIVTAHDAREVNGTAVLVTEFVSGMDLGQLLQRTKCLSVSDACEIVRQIAVALAYTHQQGFVHRDIKPSNVMLSATGEVKLLDLGLARLQYGENSGVEIAGAEITGTGQAMGTADYVAPEQVNDSKTVDIRADIYSLGCTLFKLLTGRAPFADNQHATAFAKMTAHVSKAPPNLIELLPEAPPGLVKLLDSMLAKDPNDRPQTPKQVVDAFAPYCKGNGLVNLSEAAAKLEPTKLEPKFAASASSASSVKPKTKSWIRRKVPTSVAIAAGLFGVLLGMCLSIIIVITNPDGTKSLLKLAEGSRVEIQEEGTQEGTQEGIAEQVGPAASSQQSRTFDASTPLSFGIAINAKSTARYPFIGDAALADATKLLLATNGESPVRTDYGTWFEVPNDQPLPIKVQNVGKSFTLLSNKLMITWSEIQGHVLSTQCNAMGGKAGINLSAELDDELALKFRQLTRLNLGNQLAIVVNGSIRVAPTINSEISEQIMISGAFEMGEIQQLQQWLHGELVYPLPQAKSQIGDDLGTPKPAQDATSKMGAKPAEPILRVFKLSDTQVDAKLVYQVVSTLLAGKPDVRLALDDPNRQLIVFARPTEHELVKKTLDTMTAETADDTHQAEAETSKLERAKLNLKKIGIAFHNFHDVFGKFPGTSNTREGGMSHGKDKKIYPFSWRVAILPFIDQYELFEEYRFDEPWDSDNNLTLLDKMPDVYRSPFAIGDERSGECNIIGFTGEDTALGADGGHGISEFTDGLSNTVLMIEAECTVAWTDPRDIPTDASNAALFDDHPLLYLLADGRVSSTEPVDVEKLNVMITRNAGD